MEILNGKEVSQNVKLAIKSQVDKLKEKGIFPKLVTISVQRDGAFSIYIKNKKKACDEVGIICENISLGFQTSQEELIELIEKLNRKDDVHGILLQSPVPEHIDINKAFSTISPSKDVDGFNPVNIGKLMLGQETFIPCTAKGIIRLLEYYNIEIEGKHAVIIGRSNIVGKPVMKCLLDKNATVTICHSKTKDLSKYTKSADILVVATGQEGLIKEDMVKKDSVVIDVGINFTQEGKLVGDVDFENVSRKVSYITPVPGGVGPMTVAMLLENVIIAVKNLEDPK